MNTVLDKGYVRDLGVLGSDLDVVNAARASYAKESKQFNAADEKLLNFLIRENHTSPLRHCVMRFEVYAPLFVARQWWKHAVSSSHTSDQFGWSERSLRYVSQDHEFYIPAENEWRKKPANNKQGSDGFLDTHSSPNHKDSGAWWTKAMKDNIEDGMRLYEEAMKRGVAPEQARLFLPAYAMYVRWRWTASLQSVVHFINLREEEHAQYEIQQYAAEVKEIAQEHFPQTMNALKEKQ